MVYALIAIILTLITLIVGIIVMAIGGGVNRKFSSKLMSLRVLLQALAIIIVAVLHFI